MGITFGFLNMELGWALYTQRCCICVVLLPLSAQNLNAGSYTLIYRWSLSCWVDDHYVVTVAGWFEDICGLFSYQDVSYECF